MPISQAEPNPTLARTSGSPQHAAAPNAAIRPPAVSMTAPLPAAFPLRLSCAGAAGEDAFIHTAFAGIGIYSGRDSGTVRPGRGRIYLWPSQGPNFATPDRCQTENRRSPAHRAHVKRDIKSVHWWKHPRVSGD